MSMTLVFTILVALTFLVVLLLTRPTTREKTLSRRLDTIGRQWEVETPGEQGEDILKSDQLSDVPWLDLLLARLPVATRLKREIEQADLKWSVGRLVFGSLLIFVATAWFGQFLVNSLPLALVLAVLLASVPYVYVRVVRGARLRKFNELLPDAIDLMSRALKAGHSVTSAIEMIAQEVSPPVGPEFRRLFEEQNFGLPLREAMLNFASRIPIPDVQYLVTAILVQKETGGNLVEILDKTASVLRDRMRLQGQLRIYTAQGKLTGWILSVLPFVIFGVISIINPRYAHILLEDPLGQKLIIAGLILMAFGVWVIRKVIDIKV
jgi:tight adherence protein B